MYKRILSLAVLLVAPNTAFAQGAMTTAYERAAKVLDANLTTAIRNAEVAPHWIEDGRAFWYRRDGDTGPEWLLVDAATGAKAKAFDAAALRGALGKIMKQEAIPAGLPVSALDRTSVTLALPAGPVRCVMATLDCTAAGAPARSPETSWAPSGDRGVLARDHNLWLREGAGAEPVALTKDGVANFAYGAPSDMSLFAIPTKRSTAPMPPSGIIWSPDGRYFISDRVDQRGVETYPFVEAVPQDGSFRPKLWPLRISLLGDPEPRSETAIFDAVRRSKTVVAFPDGWQPYWSAFHWPANGGVAFGLATTRAAKNIGLVRIDLATGQARLVISEATPKWGRFNAFIYSQPNVRILDATNEAIWFSERDGWGQLYLYDLRTGKLKRKLTTGARTVRDIVGIDEHRRRIVYAAGGTDRDEDPYFVRLYSVWLDGGRETLLTPERGVHLAARQPVGNASPGSASAAALSPDGAHIVESYSALDTPPVSVLRSATDGRVIATLENADVSQVAQAGWRAPMRVRTVAADGVTPLWGTIYFPREMQPGRKYPVIDAIYGGPQVTNAPADYRQAVVTMNPRARASLAELGFIVVTIDGRGTPGRSKEFNNASYDDFAAPELADHVAGIRQLAERFGTFDLDRVGIYGHSFGGYTSARAILTYPDFYKVAVSSAGPLNFQGFYPVEGIFPLPDYGHSGPVRPNATAVPDSYARFDLMPLAPKLKGKLLLAYGELDENALPSVTHQFIDALIKANKPYDLMYLPNQSHGFFRTSAYYTQRMWDYFVEHLLHETPPTDFRLKLTPMAPVAGF
jgi:dipeptidyl aminopeptidase/acylaminoacyl peptidase